MKFQAPMVSESSPNHKTGRKRGSWPERKFNRITPYQKTMVIDQYFYKNKKIKDLAKDLKINYCTAKTIIHTYRKNKPDMLDYSKAKRCTFRPISEKTDNACSVVTMIGKKVISDQSDQKCVVDNLYQQIFCDLENIESYVEKFLVIKNVEQELTNLNYSYFVEFEVNKAIFWCQRRNSPEDAET